jgi:signal transduction histidine kinase
LFSVQRSAIKGKKDGKIRTEAGNLESVGEWIEIAVADSGKGIPPENLGKIFAPYYTTKERGVGLGLAITQRMIQAHEGSLEVQSRQNQGTAVIIRLPLPAHP